MIEESVTYDIVRKGETMKWTFRMRMTEHDMRFYIQSGKIKVTVQEYGKNNITTTITYN